MNLEQLSKLEQQEINEIFESFGLNEKERLTYLALLKMGAATVSPLARHLGLPVSTTQAVLQRLQKRGFTVASAKRSRHVFEATAPAALKNILEKKLWELNQALPILKKLQTEPGGSAKLKVYYRERMTDIFQEALHCRDKKIFEIVSAAELQAVLGEKFHFTRRRLEKHISLMSLRIESTEIKKYNKAVHERELRQAKFLPNELTFKGSIMIWDDTVAFFSTKREGLAWTVESPVMRETVSQLFNLLWSVSRRMETLPEN